MFAFASALGSIVSALYFLASVYVYISLIRQISAQRSTVESAGEPTGESESIVVGSTRTFGSPEAILAALLTFWFFFVFLASISSNATQITDRELILNLLFTIFVVLGIAGLLKLRGFDLNALAGFSKLGIVRTVSTGSVLLLFAYPLIGLTEAMTQRLFGGGSSKQSIVELFNGSQTLEQRIMIIVLAVAIAPVAEEFIFRFFLYGVLKRYFGRYFGLIFNALLFAAVHAHLPSFAPLFVLGACFTLAYEWSGSILVSMTMHSLFNSITLTVLAFPQLFEQ